MRAVVTDRIAVLLIAISLGVWGAVLTVLWGWVFDPTGTGSLQCLLILGLCLWGGLMRRERLARRGVSVLRFIGLEERVGLSRALEGSLGSSRADALLRVRLLAMAGVMALLGFLWGTAMVLVAALVSALLGQVFLFGAWTWRLLEWGLMLLGWLPPAAGILAVLYAARVVRAGSGRDTYASMLRDVLWSLTLSLGVLAVAWWVGANLVFLAFGCAGVMLLAAMTVVAREQYDTHPRRTMLPFGPPGRGAAWQIAGVYAALALVGLGQFRMFADVLSLSLTRRLFWGFLSLGLLGYFLSRWDRKSRPPARGQMGGVVLGLAAGLVAQATELSACVGSEHGRWFLAMLAVGTQVPLAALAATLLSYQRRQYAYCGGTAGAYCTSAAGGVCLALLWVLWILPLPGGWIALLSVAGLCLLAGGFDGARHATRFRPRLAWLVHSSVLCAVLILGLLAVLDRASSVVGEVRPGVWLTAVGETTRSDRLYEQAGVLPIHNGIRSEILTRCLWQKGEDGGEDGIFARRRGRWWIVSTNSADLPKRLPLRIFATGSGPDPPAQPRRFRRYPPLLLSQPVFHRFARLHTITPLTGDRFDGVFLAPLPADHPQAWRVYNEQTLRRSCRLADMTISEWSARQQQYIRVRTSGLVVLRTQAAAGEVRKALQVARTFLRAVGSGWAVAAIRPTGVDLLLLGPEDALAGRSPQSDDLDPSVLPMIRETIHWQPDVFCVPIEELWADWGDVAPIRLSNPPGERLDGTPTIRGLREWLIAAQRLSDSGREASPPASTARP